MSELPVPTNVPTALVSLYGAVAAIVREDWPAVPLMVGDFTDALDTVDDVLLVTALATLECLWESSRTDEGAAAALGASGTAAREMLAIASTFGLATADTVSAAAWRLDAVRRGDWESASAAIAESRTLGSESELIYGALALLAAIITRQAWHAGRAPDLLARDICMSATLAATP